MKTGLVIEDNENNMVLITRLLEKSGYNILKAETGEKGFEMTYKFKPDFIILDIQLPDMNGIDVLKKIRNNEIVMNIPVIAMTSYAMAGDREQFLSAGCNGYIEKPIDPINVIAEIRNILGAAKK